MESKEKLNYKHQCMGCMSFIKAGSVCSECGFDENRTMMTSMHLKIRSLLNKRYLVGRVLGHGGFGVTYIAWDTKLEIVVAIKEYLPSSLAVRLADGVVCPGHTEGAGQSFDDYLEKFLNEAKILAQFNGEAGIVSVQDYFPENGTAYIVMSYVEGDTLERYVNNYGGHIPFNKALKIMRGVMVSLSKVHRTGLIHRDISPNNIYVTKDNQVRLLDFGAARYVMGDERKTASIILKKGYAPVEQYYSKGDQGPWTDVYSVAATIYRIITGAKPPESIERSMIDKVKWPSAYGVKLTSQEERAIMKGLSVKANDRYSSMYRFLIELDEGFVPEDIDETELLGNECDLKVKMSYSSCSDYGYKQRVSKSDKRKRLQRWKQIWKFVKWTFACLIIFGVWQQGHLWNLEAIDQIRYFFISRF